jgi:hypothetical protein
MTVIESEVDAEFCESAGKDHTNNNESESKPAREIRIKSLWRVTYAN